MLKIAARNTDLVARPTFHPSAFPDIRVNGYGVEAKFTKQDTWLAVGNSVFEGMRDPDVTSIYVVMGKIGGQPEARWGRYAERVTHVRVSNSPRFVVELDGERESVFSHFGISYDEFAQLSDAEKMEYIRAYSRKRLKKDEHLWWLDETHTLPLTVRVYRTLEEVEKRKLRAEATVLCPEVVQPGSVRGKYDRAGIYLITRYAVYTPQLRDLFSAGSVGARGGGRGHKYLPAALKDIEPEMREAFNELDDRLIEAYWGYSCPPNERISRWLAKADGYATDWKPSAELFQPD